MYIRRLLIVAILAVSSLFFIGKYFDYRYKKRWDWLYFSKIDEASAGKVNYDIVFFGNSRIHTGINPYIIDSVTGLTSYNFAIGSGDEQEMKLLSTVYLSNHTPPKYVVIGVDYFLLMKYDVLKERFAYLFYLNDDTVSKFMRENGFPTSLIKIAPFTKYSFFDEYNRTSIFVGNGKIKRLFGHNFYKGFINIFPYLSSDSASKNTVNETYYNMQAPKTSINDTSAKTFLEIIDIFQSKGSKVILLYPPRKNKSFTPALSQLDSFYSLWSKHYEIPFIRSDTNSLITKKYFVDENHLNEPGSELLSLSVANFIKKRN